MRVRKGLSLFALAVSLVLILNQVPAVKASSLLSSVDYRQRCREINKFLIGDRYTVKCYDNYHHYNAYAADNHYHVGNTLGEGKIQIAGYNLWLAGSLRSAYKDWQLMARVINQWDVVAATEVLPVQGEDEENNRRVVEFIDDGPRLLEELRWRSQTGRGDRDELAEKIERLKDNLNEARELYRSPGYIKLLEALRELDPSWSLILSPRGEAASSRHVQEFVGFFYRASRVRPVANEHCQENKGLTNGKGYGCFPDLSATFMGRDTEGVFSRPPFLASFESGNFDFSLLSNHVVFNSPDSKPEMERILEPAFGVSDYRELGTGANKATYARFAESKIILELMERLRKNYKEKDVIYVGDMNLESDNDFWSKLLGENFSGGELFIDGATTLTQSRFDSDGDRTRGRASNYDHFIFDPERTRGCTEPQIYSYYEAQTADYIKEHYLIRDFDKVERQRAQIPYRLRKEMQHDYDMVTGGKRKMGRKLSGLKELLLDLRTVKDRKIVWDDYRFEEKLEFFKERVFLHQLTERYFYRVYMEILSDHFPIWMSCRTDLSDND